MEKKEKDEAKTKSNKKQKSLYLNKVGGGGGVVSEYTRKTNCSALF
jgi:hypothetical protein